MEVKHVIFACWILKDASWVIIFPYTAWPALATAFVLEAFTFYKGWESFTWAVCGNHLVTLLWMIGNGTWMTAEFLFEKEDPGATFPWSGVPFIKGSHGAGAPVVSAAFATFCAAAALYLMAQAVGRYTDSEDKETIRVLDMDAWIGPWVAKDAFWAKGLLWPGLLCSVAVAALMLRSAWMPRLSKLEILAEFLWLAGNTIWMFDELYLEDEKHFSRYLAFFVLCIAFFSNVLDSKQGLPATELLTGTAAEMKRLYQ
eukprot:TRINITY_DN65114_c0_g1_i1.p1 TRINITY_DN65114_c0_g1~~TRINITY_DN65114_c0_g1_i1.p1  ORF type:complete len:257 (-),score=66.89 TRINITY_DN65114_c0_g1_i1:8-778(-)